MQNKIALFLDVPKAQALADLIDSHALAVDRTKRSSVADSIHEQIKRADEVKPRDYFLVRCAGEDYEVRSGRSLYGREETVEWIARLPNEP